jgi:GAF domain-containing protein
MDHHESQADRLGPFGRADQRVLAVVGVIHADDERFRHGEPLGRRTPVRPPLFGLFFRTGEPVGHENLDAGSGRWPSFAATAIEAGFQSAVALPLRLRDLTLGALNLLSTTRTPMAEADVILARAFADLATLSILQHRASEEAQRLNEQLSAALTSRVAIEQAKGVISERAGVHLDEAFARLRAYARHHNLRLTDVAQAAIDGTLDPLAWASPAQS